MSNQNKIPSIQEFKQSRLNVQVSCFANYVTVKSCTPVILWEWLLNDKYKNEQLKIRSATDKKSKDSLKSNLPAITPAALLHNRQKGNINNLVSLSGFLCIDIDKKDNEQLPYYNELLGVISNITNIIYAGESVSGTGYFALIPISNPDKLENHFGAIEKLLYKFYKIKVDPSKGRSFTDLRGYSFTREPYFNLEADTFTLMYNEPQKQKRVSKFILNNSNLLTELIEKVEALVCKIESQEIDLTADYTIWFNIGMAFASLGEQGREFFHRVSCFYHEYDNDQTDNQFDSCLHCSNGSITIDSFFYLCKNEQIYFNEDFHRSCREDFLTD